MEPLMSLMAGVGLAWQCASKEWSTLGTLLTKLKLDDQKIKMNWGYAGASTRLHMHCSGELIRHRKVPTLDIRLDVSIPFHTPGDNSTFQSITPNVCYVLGISDNGGSTSELLRVLGGPGIGDLRSRLTRLIITEGADASERLAIKEIMSYRLPCLGDEHKVRDEWALIVEGRHRLWQQISIEKKETIRGFLVAFNSEILKRAHKHFNFRNGSIGNFFLTGARLFFGSLEAAIFLFSAITGIRDTSVVPIINTNHTAAIAAILEDGETLRGQCEISHPGDRKCNHTRLTNPIDAFSKLAIPHSPIHDNDSHQEEQVNENLIFNKTSEEKLSAAIRRIYYMNEYGQEIYPLPNPKVIAHLSDRTTLVYSIGSLYTSIVPCLILRGVGNAIAQSPTLRHKVLILNGTPDRETEEYTAMDFITSITSALNESQLIDARHDFYDAQMADAPTPPPCQQHIQQPTAYDPMTRLRKVPVDVVAIEKWGIKCLSVKGDPLASKPYYHAGRLQAVFESILE
ncbi:hypothetical protein [Absidia glauca]|uniref:Uncharacterized protein n=1 Tax=Absidia glauca TaxID=4829 RepID=A0A168Q0I8_ABSGL|nr:hypothetical protein [Absidia glauca]